MADESVHPDESAWFDVCVVGAGLAGLTAARLIAESTSLSVRVVEASETAGGLIARSRYPGAATDLPWYLFPESHRSPVLAERLLADASWYAAYAAFQVADLDRRVDFLLGESWSAAEWENGSHWRVTLGSGAAFRTRFLVLCTGIFGEPSWPDVEGRDRFRGRQFHACGEDEVPVEGLGQVVVVGGGATAAQIVPVLVGGGGPVTQVMREPPWVLPRWNPKLPRTVADVLARSTVARRLAQASTATVMEALMWAGATKQARSARLARPMAWLSERHLRRSVESPTLRRLLTPVTSFARTRPVLSNGYWKSLTAPNATVLVDAVREVTPTGLVLESGRVVKADTIIWATGFTYVGGGNRATVRDGRGAVVEPWRIDAEHVYRGLSVRGLPNFFMAPGPGTPISWGSPVGALCQARLIARVLRWAEASGSAVVEPLAPAIGGELTRRRVWDQSMIFAMWWYRRAAARGYETRALEVAE